MTNNKFLKYKSTRGEAEEIFFSDVIFEGLASDGGLYLPEYWPKIDQSIIDSFSNMSYQEIAFHIFKPFVDGSISDNKIKELIDDSYKVFTDKNITPVNKISNNEYLLELFYGPTYAFKDIAMQFIGRLMGYYLDMDNKKINILGATSGDTGSAAIYGFESIQSSNVFILHPHNLISPTQRKFMTTIDSDNVINIAVKGNFDDCQSIIKEIFSDYDYKKSNNLGAINSINWARIMCQITYYFYSASRIENSENIVYSVPTGNFGDILAGYISKKMGLKFKKLNIATNENNILDIALKSGVHTIKDVVSTSSPSIDIQVSSNFERLIYDSCKDSSYVKEIMTNLKKEGTFTLTDECRSYISKYFTSDSASNNEVNQTISEYYSKYNITLDPHTAVGVVCGKKQSLSQDILVTLSTAHPAKFKETVSGIISDDSFVTEKVRMLENQEERMIIANNDVEEIKNIINGRIR
ncbi:MAG: threonine synthase [Gammaproteobacteria bacterium]|nr:threonine synthase [Gammaproteobacteria bacterium]MBL6819093.1 threonine synthase [Gammaproteobacteria bacterium]MBL6898744.1 threonine synthase [Gammaproteobacteria bacterium]